jgi:hypothetical protein
MHLADRTVLNNITNLVYDEKEVATSLCSSLEWTERERERERKKEKEREGEGQREEKRRECKLWYSQLAGSPFVSVEISGLGIFLE